MFWGVSEALDLVEEYSKLNNSCPESLNVLLFGSCDPRHIIKTVAKSYKHNTQINFYVVDGCVEIVARNMALLAIAFEGSACLNLIQKTHLFMDVYGNSLLRPTSQQYLASKSNILLKICTDPDFRERIAPFFNIDSLKYRERDGLENAFNFWLPKENNQFDIQKYWNDRNRNLLKTRYDHRDGAFDWDLQMCLKERGAKQLCPQEYKTWRDTGVAFTYPEFEQCYANRSLAAGLSRNGNIYHNRGYVGDVQVGPFCAFGLNSTDESMLKSSHGENEYRATEVTERNLMEMFHEIQKRTEYTHDKSISRRFGKVALQVGKNFTGLENEFVEVADYDQPFIALPNLKIYFLSVDEVFGLQQNGIWNSFFDMAFIAQNYFAFVKPYLINIFRDNGLVYFETNLYTICKKETLIEFEEKIKEFAKGLNLNCATNFNINVKYPIIKYKINKT